jgi:tetratricopeptide (TPR) repeat protein
VAISATARQRLRAVRESGVEGRTALTFLAATDAFVFHGSPRKLSSLVLHQARTFDSDPVHGRPYGRPGHVSDDIPDVAIYRALVNQMMMNRVGLFMSEFGEGLRGAAFRLAMKAGRTIYLSVTPQIEPCPFMHEETGVVIDVANHCNEVIALNSEELSMQTVTDQVPTWLSQIEQLLDAAKAHWTYVAMVAAAAAAIWRYGRRLAARITTSLREKQQRRRQQLYDAPYAEVPQLVEDLRDPYRRIVVLVGDEFSVDTAVQACVFESRAYTVVRLWPSAASSLAQDLVTGLEIALGVPTVNSENQSRGARVETIVGRLRAMDAPLLVMANSATEDTSDAILALRRDVPTVRVVLTCRTIPPLVARDPASTIVRHFTTPLPRTAPALFARNPDLVRLPFTDLTDICTLAGDDALALTLFASAARFERPRDLLRTLRPFVPESSGIWVARVWRHLPHHERKIALALAMLPPLAERWWGQLQAVERRVRTFAETGLVQLGSEVGSDQPMWQLVPAVRAFVEVRVGSSPRARRLAHQRAARWLERLGPPVNEWRTTDDVAPLAHAITQHAAAGASLRARNLHDRIMPFQLDHGGYGDVTARLRAFQAPGYPRSVARNAAICLGQVYLRSGDYLAARATLEPVIVECESRLPWSAEAYCAALVNLAGVCDALFEYEASERCIDALEYATRYVRRPIAANLRRAAARQRVALLSARGEHDAALALAERVLASSEGEHDHSVELEHRNTRARCLAAAGRFAEALSDRGEALRVLADAAGVLTLHHTYAESFLEIGALAESRTLALAGLAKARLLNEWKVIVEHSLLLAELELIAGQPDAARAYATEAAGAAQVDLWQLDASAVCAIVAASPSAPTPLVPCDTRRTRGVASVLATLTGGEVDAAAIHDLRAWSTVDTRRVIRWAELAERRRP